MFFYGLVISESLDGLVTMFGPCCPWMGVAGLCQGHQGWNVSCKKSWTPFPCPLTLSISIGIRGWDVWCRNCSAPRPIHFHCHCHCQDHRGLRRRRDVWSRNCWTLRSSPIEKAHCSNCDRHKDSVCKRRCSSGGWAKDSLSVRLDAGGKIRSRKPYYILPIAHWTTETGLSNQYTYILIPEQIPT